MVCKTTIRGGATTSQPDTVQVCQLRVLQVINLNLTVCVGLAGGGGTGLEQGDGGGHETELEQTHLQQQQRLLLGPFSGGAGSFSLQEPEPERTERFHLHDQSTHSPPHPPTPTCPPWGSSCCTGRGEGRSFAGRWTCLCFCLRSWPSAAEEGSEGSDTTSALLQTEPSGARCARSCGPYRWGAVVQGHEARRCVSQHGEVRGGRGAHGQRAAVGVHLVVDQTPLLQEGVNPGDTVHVHSAQLANSSRGRSQRDALTPFTPTSSSVVVLLYL